MIHRPGARRARRPSEVRRPVLTCAAGVAGSACRTTRPTLSSTPQETAREVPRRTRRPRRRRRLGRPRPARPAERPGARRPADRGRRPRRRDQACSSRRSTTRPRPARPSTPTSATRAPALVSGRLLADICRSLPSKTVEVSVEGNKVGRSPAAPRGSRLQTMPVEDYPSLPEMPEARGTVPSGLFANAVNQAVTAAGRDDMLPVLTGVRLEMEGESIALLATDRFRLSSRELTWSPEHLRRQRRGAGAGQGARRHRQVADRRRARSTSRWPPVARARGSSASRAPRAAASGARRPGCWTASSPRSARCSRAST